MNTKLGLITSLAVALVLIFDGPTTLLAANTGALAISVAVAEKCRVDFSEGSADYFQVCNAGIGVNSEKSKNVLGATIAIDPSADPYYLDRDPDNPSREASAGSGAPPALASARRGPKVVHIQY